MCACAGGVWACGGVFVCVCGLVGRVCVLTLQFHTCLILSEFGVKGFVEECVCCGLGAGQRGNEGGGREQRMLGVQDGHA